MRFGAFLSAARGTTSRRGLARRCAEVAPEVTGITEASLRFWESERFNRVPTLGQYAVLVEALGLSPEERLRGLELARSRVEDITRTRAA
jgi:hypothetical protein